MEARWATAREMRKVYEDKARMVKCVRCVLAMRVDGDDDDDDVMCVAQRRRLTDGRTDDAGCG